MSTLEFNKRNEEIPNSAKKARKAGKVPGIIYSNKMNNFMFEVGELELGKEFSTHGERGIISYNLGGNSHKALVKEVQKDPVTHKVIHLDLEELDGNEKIISSVPIHYIGEEMLQKKGIVLQKERDTVKVECDAENLPKFINVNINKGAVGSVYRLGDLEVASELTILDDLSSVVASISSERKTVSEDMEASVEANAEAKSGKK